MLIILNASLIIVDSITGDNTVKEQAYAYQHFENITYFLFAIGLGLGLIALPFFLGTIIELPVFIAFSIVWLLFLTYCFSRIVAFARRNKSISQKVQMQIIKRHRYSLKWSYIVIPLSVFTTFTFARIFEMTLIQAGLIFNATLVFTTAIGTGLFLRNLKLRMSS